MKNRIFNVIARCFIGTGIVWFILAVIILLEGVSIGLQFLLTGHYVVSGPPWVRQLAGYQPIASMAFISWFLLRRYFVRHSLKMYDAKRGWILITAYETTRSKKMKEKILQHMLEISKQMFFPTMEKGTEETARIVSGAAALKAFAYSVMNREADQRPDIGELLASSEGKKINERIKFLLDKWFDHTPDMVTLLNKIHLLDPLKLRKIFPHLPWHYPLTEEFLKEMHEMSIEHVSKFSRPVLWAEYHKAIDSGLTEEEKLQTIAGLANLAITYKVMDLAQFGAREVTEKIITGAVKETAKMKQFLWSVFIGKVWDENPNLPRYQS